MRFDAARNTGSRRARSRAPTSSTFAGTLRHRGVCPIAQAGRTRARRQDRSRGSPVSPTSARAFRHTDSQRDVAGLDGELRPVAGEQRARDDGPAPARRAASVTASGRSTTSNCEPSAHRAVHRQHAPRRRHSVAATVASTAGPKPRNSAVHSSTGRRHTSAAAPACTTRPAAHHHEAVGQRERFLVVVRHVDRGQAACGRGANGSHAAVARATDDRARRAARRASRRRGSTASARASATRCCSPPDSPRDAAIVPAR